ncbi:hypothetical protein As57867_007055, partial [Aphanomyces stellatus]
MPQDATPTADDEAKKIAQRLKRRGYIRKMMQQYRQKEKLDLVHLRSEVLNLQLQLRHLQTNPIKQTRPYDLHAPLAWKYIAEALLAERRHALDQTHLLQEQLDSVTALVQDLSQWVAANSSRLPMTPRESNETWRHMSLLGGTDSRRLGKDWILQQMRHNTDRMFKEHAFPPMQMHHCFHD